MEILYGDDPPERLLALVGKRDRLFFVQFLLRYMRRLAGEERHQVSVLAQPFLPALSEELKSRSAERRARAVQTVGELGMPRYASQIVEALDDPAALVAFTAARALARREHPQFAEAIVERLHRFANWRPSLLGAMLAGMGGEAAAALRSAYGDDRRSPQVRAIAGMALAHLHDARAAPIAARIVAKETHRELAAASIRLLGRIGRPEDLPLIRRCLASSDEVVRGAAAAALGRIGAPVDLPTLHSAACEDGSRWVALAAARAVRDLGGIRQLRELAASTHERAALALQVLAEAGA